METNPKQNADAAEYEQTSKSSKEEIKARMKRLSEAASMGFSTSGGASIRDLGFAMSSARGSIQNAASSKISVKEIAKLADSQVIGSRGRAASITAAKYTRDAASMEEEEEEKPAKAAALPNTRKTRSMSVGAVSRHRVPITAARGGEEDEEVEMPKLNVNAVRAFLQQEAAASAAAKTATPTKPRPSTTTSSTPITSNKFLAQDQLTRARQKQQQQVITTSTSFSTNNEPNSPSIVTRANARPSDLGKPVAAKLERAVEDKTLVFKKETVAREVKTNFADKEQQQQQQQRGAGGEDRRKYTLAQLRQRPGPPDVDIFAKEDFLTPEEFAKAFGVSPQVFAKLPSWKKVEMRKQAKIF